MRQKLAKFQALKSTLQCTVYVHTHICIYAYIHVCTHMQTYCVYFCYFALTTFGNGQNEAR